jgi:hypothetical protein
MKRTASNKSVCASGLCPHARFARTSHTAGTLIRNPLRVLRINASAASRSADYAQLTDMRHCECGGFAPPPQQRISAEALTAIGTYLIGCGNLKVT